MSVWCAHYRPTYLYSPKLIRGWAKTQVITRCYYLNCDSQNDILDNPNPCKMKLGLWNTKCRYNPKYAPQYTSKHTNYLKFSSLVRFPLDTHSWHPNREWPHLWNISRVNEEKLKVHNMTQPLDLETLRSPLTMPQKCPPYTLGGEGGSAQYEIGGGPSLVFKIEALIWVSFWRVVKFQPFS